MMRCAENAFVHRKPAPLSEALVRSSLMPQGCAVDVYGFIDVFEIKRHDTGLLAFDQSHENYYWKPEVAQALSQIENYIDAVITNAAEYTKVRAGASRRGARPRGVGQIRRLVLART